MLKKYTADKIKETSFDDIVKEQYKGTEFEQYFEQKQEKEKDDSKDNQQK